MRNFGKLKAYHRKNKRLKWLGYESYQAYLQSPEWKEIRRRVLGRDNFECVACGAPADCVHHNGYHTAALTGQRSLSLSRATLMPTFWPLINSTYSWHGLHRCLPGRCKKCMKGPPRKDVLTCTQ